MGATVAAVLADAAAETAAVLRADELLAHVEHLTPEEQAELAILYENLIGGEGPEEFIARVWPDEPVPRHMMPVVRAIERARVMPIRLCISLPPGHAKTTVLMRLIVWWLSRSPADLCAYLTYSDKQARDKSGIALEGAHLAGLPLRARSRGRRRRATSSGDQSLSLWRTPQGGGLYARGIKAGITGNRIPGLLVIDDPYKDQAEAESETINERAKKRLKTMARTRLQGGSIIIVHTRWTEDDLIGYAAAELGFEYINIPAIAEDPEELGDDYVGDPLGWRKPGEPAWPERYPVAQCSGSCGHDGHLAEHMDDVDLFSAMFQGRPSAGGGGMFRDENLPIVEPEDVPDGGDAAAGWDLAYTKGKRSAWTVRVKVKIVGGIIFILDVLRRRVSADELLDFIEATERAEAGQARNEAGEWEQVTPGEWVAVDVPEDGPAGATFTADLLKRLDGFAFYWSREQGGSKKMRAMPFAAQARGKRVRLVRGEWNGLYRKEARSFPLGVFKDQIDATVRAVNRAWMLDETGTALGGSASHGAEA